jgi:glutathione S-transferase
VPRTPEYLAINPRGLVPSLVYGDEIITESAVVANFLADAYPSHLVPASNDPNGPLTRARIAFFADTFSSKLVGPLFKGAFAPSDEEGSKIFKEFVDVVVKEVEPLLADAAPFFGGSEQLTLAEVCLSSIRNSSLAVLYTDDGKNTIGSHGVIRHSPTQLAKPRTDTQDRTHGTRDQGT